MNPHTPTPPAEAGTDEDLIEQAHPGHGVPSQDPSPSAQFPLEPGEAQRESRSVYAGGGILAGAAAGAALGAAVAGPVGVVVGGAAGGVAGAVGAAVATAAARPDAGRPGGH